MNDPRATAELRGRVVALFYRLPWVKVRLGDNRPEWATSWWAKNFQRFDGHYWCGLTCFYSNERLCRRGR